MLIVIADITSTAADVDQLRQAIADMQEASQAEPGCISYSFNQEIADPNKIRVVEQWETLEDLQAHFTMPHMATFQKAMAQNPPKGMEAKLYEVAQELPFPTP